MLSSLHTCSSPQPDTLPVRGPNRHAVLRKRRLLLRFNWFYSE